MKRFSFLPIVVLSAFATDLACAQTLYSPSTLGSSTTSNVGIGVSNPQHKFEVLGDILGRNTTASTYGAFRLFNDQNSSTRALFIGYSGSTYASSMITSGVTGEAAAINTTGSYPLMLGTSNTLRMIILANGKVGVGTSSPTATFEVNGTITGVGNLLTNSLGIGKYGATLAGDTDPFQIYSPADNGTHDLLLYGNGGNSILNLRLYDGDLKVGAGTTPATILRNNGTASFGGLVNFVGDQIQFSETRGIDYDAATNSMFYNGGSGQSVKLGDPSGNGWFLGSLCIGTTTSDAPLTVKGQVHAQEVKVDLNGAIAPDYVFEEDYRLLSLEEVQSYIQSNKHLPEVPSAKEMEATGINVTEMNLLLLKKVEELTLYIIDQKQQLDQLKEENRKQGEAIGKLASKQ